MTTSETPASLLERLRSGHDQRSWEQFVHLYTPLIWHWSKTLHVADQERSDFVQDVFAHLVKQLPAFEYDSSKRFRGWLWMVVLNKRRELLRQQSVAANPASGISDIAIEDVADSVDEEEYRRYLIRRIQQIIKADFEPATWQAFWQIVIAERPVAEVAAELGISESAAYKHKSRVLRRLRQELAGLMEW